MLDIGHKGAQVFITRGDDLVFYKYIDIGGLKINETGVVGISPLEAMQMRSPDHRCRNV